MYLHHSALDFHVGNNEVNVGIYASHEGYVNIYENAKKWRDLTEKSGGEWIYGKWNPNVGFGYANPANFGIK